ncbi:hypothetical protein EMQ25_08565 [Arsenicitalea aurantiaca]|uniref:Uncharacterized protein n=1 Tax=Arsenicitalea aurantiaca TaxID=1783274 RepID=A0A433XGJ5_9HYPH|nr:polysaccharide biosynthesis C-terminal domain-containing protein [Arsenicitalea aurantiaca]RUT33162.1 hypothetical protein EMQ25_08565 [Arsenicitalea aurantiaca]
MSLMRRLASQSALIFAARIGGAGLVFLAQALIARQWGAAGLADYLVVFAAVNLIAMAMPLGFNTIGTFFASRYGAAGEGAMLARFMARAYLQIGLVALGLALLATPLLPLLGAAGAVLLAHLPQLLLIAAGTAMVWVSGAVLVGLRRPFAGLLADGVVRPLAIGLALFLALLLSPGGQGLGLLLWIFAGLYGLVAIGHLTIALRSVRALPRTDVAARPGEAARWWRLALPWAIVGLATDFFFDIDLLILSGLLAPEDLAVFGVAARIFGLVAFAVSAVYALTLPDLFEAAAAPDKSRFEARVADANLAAAGLALALLVGVILGGPLLFMLFGPEFASGAAPLVVLCLGLLIRAGFGPAALILSMRDRPWAGVPAVGLGLCALVLANLVLVPAFGLMGAALAALLATTLWSAANWLVARRLLGIDVSILARLRRGPAPGNARSGA